MSTVLVSLPCSARALEAALHRACDHDGLWDAIVNFESNSLTLGSAPVASATGNTASMRSTLEYIQDLINKGMLEANLNDVEFTVNAALSAKPRNCDRFGGNFKILYTAWFDWTGSPSGRNPDGTAWMTFAKWLLAPVDAKLAKCESKVAHA